MLIVDAQIHLWNAGNPTSPWHCQIPAYLKGDTLAEMEGVSTHSEGEGDNRRVIVEPTPEYVQQHGGTAERPERGSGPGGRGGFSRGGRPGGGGRGRGGFGGGYRR